MTSDFDDIFDFKQMTPEQRAEDRKRFEREQNQRDSDRFEAERTRREEYLAMDHRIRSIVREENNKLILSLMWTAALIWLGYKYGWLGTIGVLTVGGIWFWRDMRKAERATSYKIEDVDRLAEDIVSLERAAEFSEAGKPWYKIKATYVECDDLFEFPYWERVNKKVSLLVRKEHKDRLAELASARAAILEDRLRLQDELTEKGRALDMPYWARLEPTERKVSR